jgi:hypothetical protein
LLEDSWRYVAVLRPNPAPLGAGIVQCLEAAVIGAVFLDNPGPVVENHLKLDVPRRGKRLAEGVGVMAVIACWGEHEIREVVPNMGNARQAAATVDRAARIGFRENGNPDIAPADERFQKRLGFEPAGLYQLRRIDEIKPHNGFQGRRRKLPEFREERTKPICR